MRVRISLKVEEKKIGLMITCQEEMLLEMKCVFEAVYDESDFYYTHSYIQLYTQAKFALKILSHNFQVQILNTSRVCV